MGMTWKSTMVLLSTLAALVIIVHSAEEDFEERRLDIRARSFDIETPTYEEPWKTIEEPIQRDTTQADNWDLEYVEDAPKRRRPRRKRKRRPQMSSEEDTAPQKRYLFNEDIQPFHDPEVVYETSEQPRRRRKRPEVRLSHWAAETEDRPRPIRRRGQGKKRPPAEIRPSYPGYEHGKEVFDVEEQDTIHRSDDENSNDETVRNYEPSNDQESVEINSDNYRPQKESQFNNHNEDAGNKRFEPKHENPISDYSQELTLSTETYERQTGRQAPEQKQFKLTEKNQENEPIDPTKLKEILKKSNGASLSEILQQNNLTLSDLLHGRAKAIKTLKSKDTTEPETEGHEIANSNNEKNANEKSTVRLNEEINNSRSDHVVEYVSEQTMTTEPIKPHKITEGTTTTKIPKRRTNKPIVKEIENKEIKQNTLNQTLETKENGPKFNGTRRRLLGSGIRRKVRLNTTLNSTQKSQLNRDLMTLTARKYYNQNHRNASKSKEWKDVVPAMINATSTTEKTIENTETISPSFIPDELTTTSEIETFVSTTVSVDDQTKAISESTTLRAVRNESTQATTVTPTETTKELDITDKPKVTPIIKTEKNNSGSRRQALNNRLKRKRQKHKNLSTESPKNELLEDVYGMVNLVSASEFIERTQKPKTTVSEVIEFSTDLEDFLTTQTASKPEVVTKPLKNSYKFLTTPDPITQITTEETAKFEIEEIFNDTQTSARLSKILMERNMTLSELVEHRERGSSHVHLADIFHNASKEPNPPEPFLSKSLIEPISREIYPLRALLEANLHNTTAKATTIDPNTTIMNMDQDQTLQDHQFSNIPVVMDFGNNVNENAENMGIMSLFNKFAQNSAEINTEYFKKDSDGTPYVTSIISLNTSDPIENARESRILEDDDVAINWNDIFALMKKQQNETEEVLDSLAKGLHPDIESKSSKEKDLDGDGLIVLEDRQHLSDLEDNVASASNEKIEMSLFEQTEVSNSPGILNDGSSNVKSVTVATVSIVGLSMVLFLLTYAAFKWYQQKKNRIKKDSFSNERIPSPVFENRKGHKNNSSNRSISPMLTSNIYTMNTLDSQNGKDSPDYLWDSLRKPFQ